MEIETTVIPDIQQQGQIGWVIRTRDGAVLMVSRLMIDRAVNTWTEIPYEDTFTGD